LIHTGNPAIFAASPAKVPKSRQWGKRVNRKSVFSPRFDLCGGSSFLLEEKVLILPLPDALSPITGGVGGRITLRATSNKKLLMRLPVFD